MLESPGCCKCTHATHRYTIYSQRRALNNCGRRILFNNWISRHQSGIMAIKLSSQYILLSWCPQLSQARRIAIIWCHRRGHGPLLLIMCRRHDIPTCNSGSADRAWPAELLFCIPCSTNYKHWDSTELRRKGASGVKNNKGGMAKHNLITIEPVSVFWWLPVFTPAGLRTSVNFYDWLWSWALTGWNAAWALCEVFLSPLCEPPRPRQRWGNPSGEKSMSPPRLPGIKIQWRGQIDLKLDHDKGKEVLVWWL